VTGAGRGIGRATALGLARLGVRTVLVARSAGELDHTAQLITDLGGVAVTIPADLSQADDVDATIGKAQEAFGALDILINNAATVAPLGPSVSLDPAEWAAAIALNVTAVARLSFAVLPAILDQGWGRIVNVSSGIATHPAAMLRANAYATSKAAVEAHTLNLAAELAGTGVAVNVFRPGGVDTAMQAWIRDQDPDRVGSELHDRFIRSHQSGTLLTPEQSARSLLTRLPGETTGQIWDATDDQET
jgi:NAD(P)-dependent dehydrogenase (short-subunit alcohol dehydrogenase family)